MKLITSLLLCLSLLSGCANADTIKFAPTPNGAAQQVSIRGTTQQPDPVEQRIHALNRQGQLKLIRVLESFPQQFIIKAAPSIIEELDQLSRQTPPSTNQQNLKAQQALDMARLTWSQQRLRSYTYSLERSCFCPPEYREPINLHIIGQDIVYASLKDGTALPKERQHEAKTVEDLFALIQQAITQSATVVRVQYDNQYGHPRSIYIDHDARMADEETSLTISTLNPANGGIAPPR